MVAVYPPISKKARPHTAQNRKDGSSYFDLDHVAIGYGSISEVIVTLEPKSKGIGFDSKF